MGKKIVVTLRLDLSQYNTFVTEAAVAGVSLNEYALMKLGVQEEKKNPSYLKRGRTAEVRGLVRN